MAPMRFLLLALLLVTSAAVPLPAQRSGVTLGKAPFNGLKARIAGIQFFESAGGIPAQKDRVVTTKFDALTTRFINLELELSYAKAAKRTPFQVECRFEGPAGAARSLTLAGTVEAGWIGSFHAGGVGSPERGAWAEGVYKVTCREEGQLVAAAQIEVVKSAPAVRTLGAAVLQMKFYQSQAERLPIETRRYSTRFDTRSAKWIKTEFALVYRQASAPVSFLVECAYVFPDSSVKRVQVERQIPAGWTGSVHVQGIGWDEAGHWPVGKYRASCWNNGERMSESGFEVFDGATAVPGTPGGRLRFYAGKVDDVTPPTAAPATLTAFELGGYDTLYVEASLPGRLAGDSTNFGCSLTDPAGITSGFALKGEVRERDKLLIANGPIGILDPPKLRGAYRVECRTGAKGVLVDRFEVTGRPELTELDARLSGVGLFDTDAEPGDEAVPDVVFSAAKLKTLWVVAVLDHPSEKGVGPLVYSCRVTGPKNLIAVNSGPQTLSIGSGARTIVLRQRLGLPGKQRWAQGKYVVNCLSGIGSLVKAGFDVVR